MIYDGEYIPDKTIKAISNYVTDRSLSGDFLSAVLCNDLKEACGQADSENSKAIITIVKYLYNEIPSICWGSSEKVKTWISADIKV